MKEIRLTRCSVFNEAEFDWGLKGSKKDESISLCAVVPWGELGNCKHERRV